MDADDLRKVVDAITQAKVNVSQAYDGDLNDFTRSLSEVLGERKIKSVIALGIGTVRPAEEGDNPQDYIQYEESLNQLAILLNVIERFCPNAEKHWHEPHTEFAEEIEALSSLGFNVKGRSDLEELIFDGDQFLDGTNLYFLLGADYFLLDSVLKLLSANAVLHKSIFITGIYKERKVDSKFITYYFENANAVQIPSFGGALDGEFIVSFQNPLQSLPFVDRIRDLEARVVQQDERIVQQEERLVKQEERLVKQDEIIKKLQKRVHELEELGGKKPEKSEEPVVKKSK